MTKQQFKIQHRALRLARNRAERTTRQLYRRVVSARLASLVASVHSDIASIQADIAEVDNFIASGKSTICFRRELNTPACPRNEWVRPRLQWLLIDKVSRLVNI